MKNFSVKKTGLLLRLMLISLLIHVTSFAFAQEWELYSGEGKKSPYIVIFKKTRKVPGVDTTTILGQSTYTLQMYMDSVVTFDDMQKARSRVIIDSITVVQTSVTGASVINTDFSKKQILLNVLNFYPPVIVKGKLADSIPKDYKMDFPVQTHSVKSTTTKKDTVFSFQLYASVQATFTIPLIAGTTTLMVEAGKSKTEKTCTLRTSIDAGKKQFKNSVLTMTVNVKLTEDAVKKTNSKIKSKAKNNTDNKDVEISITYSSTATFTRNVVQGVPTYTNPKVISENTPIEKEDLLYQHLSRNRRYFKFRLYQRETFYISLNYTPSYGGRIIEISQPLFKDYALLDKTNTNEYAGLLFKSMNLQLGYNFHYSHVLFAQFNAFEKGLQFNDSADINLETGKEIRGNRFNKTYRYYGFGLGYKFINDHSHLVNFIFESGFLFNWVSGNSSVPYRNKFACSGKLGMGVSINLSYWWDFNILPNFIYDLTPVQGTVFNSRFYNAGVDFGLGFRLAKKRTHK